MLTVDKFGRRPLLLIGVAGMFGSSLLIGIACQVAYSSVAATYITIVMLFVFVGSYQVRPTRSAEHTCGDGTEASDECVHDWVYCAIHDHPSMCCITKYPAGDCCDSTPLLQHKS